MTPNPTDPLQAPPASKPVLTAAMLSAASDAGTPHPGAGGWTPSASTVYAIGAIGTTCGALAASLPGLIPGHLGTLLAGISGAIAGGCVFFAAKSAGPRVVS